MTPGQIALVQASWKQVTPFRDVAAVLFYARLFAIDPSLKPLFPKPLDVQGRRMMAHIGTAVACLGRIAELAPTVQDLGRRHQEHGTRDAHYDTIAETLLWTLEQCLDSEFTPEVRSAWRAAYATLSNVMKDAANEPVAGEAVA